MSGDLRVSALHKRFAGHAAVDGIEFTIPQGGFGTLLGPSGCGKSTTLRCIAGIEVPDAGRIEIDGLPVYDGGARINVPAHRRSLGMVFQSFALWPHRTVVENVSYPLRVAGFGADEMHGRVRETLDLLGLGGLEGRYPSELSGGQQQRVALARALVRRADTLLLDEPLSNLDAKLRDRARIELKRLQRTLGLTVLYVTHNQVEALGMSDVIVVMRNGRIVQTGTPREIYERPKDAYVADFVGSVNLLQATAVGRDGGATLVEVEEGARLRCDGAAFAPSGPVRIMIRPEDVLLATADPGGENVWPCRIEDEEYVGEHTFYDVSVCRNVRLRVRADKNLILQAGGDAWVRLPAASLKPLDEGLE